MKPEELVELHKLLQPLYRRMMGEWQRSDRFYCEGVIWTVISSSCRDDVICGMSDENWRRNFVYDDAAILRIPLTIDSENPERGLHGMLRDFLSLNDNGGEFAVYIKVPPRTWVEAGYKGDTPTIAILRALAAQEGVE